jgi:transcriptional regulator with XRE-family HTH domain
MLKAFLDLHKINKQRLAGRLKMSKQNLYQLFKSKELQADTVKAIEKELKVSWAQIKEQSVNIAVNIEPARDATGQALVNLTESNKILAESNKTLANSHAELVTMVKGVVPDQQGTSVTDLARFSDFLEVLADVGSGKRWHSKKEALAELNKLLYGRLQKKPASGIRDGSGK